MQVAKAIMQVAEAIMQVAKAIMQVAKSLLAWDDSIIKGQRGVMQVNCKLWLLLTLFTEVIGLTDEGVTVNAGCLAPIAAEILSPASLAGERLQRRAGNCSIKKEEVYVVFLLKH